MFNGSDIWIYWAAECAYTCKIFQKWNMTRVLFNYTNNSDKSSIKIEYSNVHMHMHNVYWILELRRNGNTPIRMTTVIFRVALPPPPKPLWDKVVRQAISFVCLRRVIHVYYIMTSDPTCIIYYHLLFLIYTYLEQRSPCILVHKAGYYNDSRKWDRYSLKSASLKWSHILKCRAIAL